MMSSRLILTLIGVLATLASMYATRPLHSEAKYEVYYLPFDQDTLFPISGSGRSVMFRVTSLVDSKSDREYLVNLLKGADGRKRPFDPGLVRLRIEDPDLGLIQVDKRGTVQFETKEPIGLGSARFESLQGFFYLNFPQNSAVTYLTPKYKD